MGAHDKDDLEDRLISISSAPRVTREAIESAIIAEHYFTAFEGRIGAIMEGSYESIGSDAGSDKDLNALKLLTFCVLVLNNGYTVHGISACASPENFNQEIGRTIARANAVTQIWPLMGYELRTRLHHQESMTSGDPLGEALTMLLASSFGNTKALRAEHARMILAELIPVNIESNEQIAQICHSANRSWCELNGDMSQPEWSELPQGLKNSLISGVAFVRANPDAGEAAQHEEWMRTRLADGWTYGPIKDPETKTHPCLVPFNELPETMQFKDRLFRTIVLACLRPDTTAKTTNHLSLVRN